MAIDPNLKTAALPGGLSRKRPVAAYIRSATQLEGESLRKQLEAIVPYARHHGMQLIRVYCDECRSGLRIDGRPGLLQMFRDIESGARDFDALLMSDYSRWGRFQDPGQGAGLVFECRKAGIEVHYCADKWHDRAAVAKRPKPRMAEEQRLETVDRGRCAARTAHGDAVAGGTAPKAQTL